jgi:hypothetical protein
LERPVLSPLRETLLEFEDRGGGEFVATFVARVARVTLHPMPVDLVDRNRRVESPPQIFILHRLLRLGFPAVAFPAAQPFGDAIA